MSEHGSVSLMKYVMSLGKIDFEGETEDGKIPVHYACFNDHFSALELLLEHCNQSDRTDRGGYEPCERPDNRERTPLHFACEYGSKEMIDLLIKEGGDIFWDSARRCSTGETAWHNIMRNPDNDVIKSVLSDFPDKIGYGTYR